MDLKSAPFECAHQDTERTQQGVNPRRWSHRLPGRGGQGRRRHWHIWIGHDTDHRGPYSERPSGAILPSATISLLIPIT